MTSAEDTIRRSRILEWRDWSLPVKLTAVVLVPLLFAITLGVGQIQWQVDRAGQYGHVKHTLNTINQVEPLLVDLQAERRMSVESLLGQGDPSAVQTRAAQVNNSAGQLKYLVEDIGSFGGIVYRRLDELQAQLGKLEDVRQKVRNKRLPPQLALEAYTPVIQAVSALGRALSSSVADRNLSGTSTALQDMLVLMEEVRYQQVWALTGLAQDSLPNQALITLYGSRARLLNKIQDARATLAPYWQRRLDATVSGSEALERDRVLSGIVMASAAEQSFSGMISPQDWNAKSDAVVRKIKDGHSDLSDEVRSGASKAEDEASDAAGLDSVLLLSALLVAAFVITAITRQLLASLRQLRRSALDSAQHDLPESVERVRQGDHSTEVRPVPVDTTEEVGQVARAFDEVNRQALRLAAEQATLRRGYSDSFVSVSRRSQSLLERQLRLFEQLEQDEEDPDQLATLFQLDHLATRMRRNNENLMVLSGSDLARRFAQPAPLADVLQSAVSEIEQYPRVVVQPPPTVHLVGHMASDLVRLLAELIDNAANFSSKETAVTVFSYQAGDGSITVDVLDEGIGMGNAELAEYNRQLLEVSEADPATSRRMGLFVVARLAQRHGIAVWLHGGSDVEGVRATVEVPVDHLIAEDGDRKRSAAPTPAQGAQRNGTTHHELPISGSFTTAMSYSEDPGFPKQDQIGTGSSLPKRAVSGDPSGMFGSTPAGSRNESEQDEFPTEHLFTPLDIPQQPNTEEPDFSWAWPEGEPEPERPVPESPLEPSPMFEEVSSQWFQSAGQKAEPGFVLEDADWPGASSEAGRHVEGVGATETPQPSSSLPRRNPQGGQATEQESPTDASSAGESQGHRDPEALRERLAEFQTDVRFGPGASVPRPAESASQQQTSGEAWNFASDGAWKRASEAANPEPTSFTSAGLPQRTPRAQLAPGSASSGDGEDDSASFQRSADDLRGRLADFQSGLRRGRHRAPDEN